MLALGQYYKAQGGEVSLIGHPDSKFNASTTYFTQFYVRWVDFCDTVDSANTVKGLEHTPLGQTTRDFGSAGDLKPNGVALSALDKIKTQVKTSGILVKHFFQDFESNQNSVMIVGHVTKQQFAQCFSRLKLNVSPAEFDALCVMFERPAGDSVIDYRSFVNMVDPAPPSINPWKTNDTVADAEAGGSTNSVAPAPAPVAVPVEAREVILRLQAACKNYGIRIHEFFRDFDRLRTGEITTPQFEKGLSMALDKLDCSISAAEVAVLASAYPGAAGPGRVRWHDMCNDIDAVFTTKGLEAMPTGPIPSEALSASATRLLAPVAASAGSLSAAEEELCATAMAHMKSHLDTRRVQLEPFFKDFAANQNSPMRVSNVTDIQFAQVLSRLGLAVTEPQVAALAKKFRSSGGGATKSSGFVNFHVFCHALQPPPPHINVRRSLHMRSSVPILQQPERCCLTCHLLSAAVEDRRVEVLCLVCFVHVVENKELAHIGSKDYGDSGPKNSTEE